MCKIGGGDDKPALIGVASKIDKGDLQAWHTIDGGTIVNVDRQIGTSWHADDGAHIVSIKGFYDYAGYGNVGIAAVSNTAPWLRVYPSKKINPSKGNTNFGATQSWQGAWERVVGSNTNFPTAARPNNKSSYAYPRDYPSVVVDGKVVPALGYGPINYMDVVVGTGTTSLGSLNLNWGWSNNSGIRYPGQN